MSATLTRRPPFRRRRRLWLPSAPAAPITPGAIRDTFNEAADGVPLASHTPNSGGPWTIVGTPTPTITKNRLVGSGGTKIEHNIGAANVRITAKLSIPAGGSYVDLKAAAGAGLSSGLGFRLNRTDNALQLLSAAGSAVHTMRPRADVVANPATESNAFDVEFCQVYGHTLFRVNGEVGHAFNADYILGWTHPTSNYASLIPTGTRAGVSFVGDGFVDAIEIEPIERAEIKKIAIIGDSTSPFVRGGIGWPVVYACLRNEGLTYVIAFNGGGEGASKGGSSGNDLLRQWQLVFAEWGLDIDEVIILIGTNDDPAAVASNTDNSGGPSNGEDRTARPHTVEGLFDETFDQMDSDGLPLSKVFVLSILPAVTETYHASNRTEIAASVASHPGVTLYDTSDWLDPAVDTIRDEFTGDPDGLHPDAKGHHGIGTSLLAQREPAASGTGGRRRVW